MVDSQTSPTEDSIPPLPISQSIPTQTTTTTTQSSSISQPLVIQQRPLLRSTGSQSINFTENQDNKQKTYLNNQTAQIVQAKYSYEPLQFSPNDHPEVELPLNLGDYYLIYGEVDEVN